MSTSSIALRPFGSTGFDASVLGFGGAPIGDEPTENGVAIVNRAIDLGINYIDTADCYGHSEETIGHALGPRRGEVFLATKYDARDGKGAEELLHRSLERLRTDHIDLYQLHGLNSSDDLDKMFAPDGAMRTVLKAQEEGLVRFLGVTGHANPPVFAEALRRHPFTCVLVPINVIESVFLETVLSTAQDIGAAINAMKTGGGGAFTSDELVAKSLRYNLTLRTNVTLLGIRTMAQLEHAVSIVLDEPPLSTEELDAFRREREMFAATDPHAYWWRTDGPLPDARYKL